MSLPYFPMYPSDFEAKTSHLTLEEDGAYNRILRLMWMTPGCSLPDDAGWIARRMRCDEATFERVVTPLISEFLKRKNGRIFSPRLSEEYEKVDESHRRRVEAGKLGGRPKDVENKRKQTKQSLSNAKAMPKQPEPEPEPDKERKKNARSRFSEFWEAYPHKDGKKGKAPSQASYDRAVGRGVPEQDIIDGAKRAHHDRAVIAGYVRNPQTWINQKGWEDEIAPTSQQSSQAKSSTPTRNEFWRKVAGAAQ